MRKFSHVVRQCSSGLQPAVVLCNSTRGGNFGHEGIKKITKTQTGILATEERLASMIVDSVRPLLVPARCERWAAGRPAGREPDVAKETAHG